jgi:hypothetical protein
LRPLRQLFEPTCHASVLDLLCFTKSSGEPILLAIAVASVLVSQAEVRSEPALEASRVPRADRILGTPIHGEAEVERYARSVGCTRYIICSTTRCSVDYNAWDRGYRAFLAL